MDKKKRWGLTLFLVSIVSFVLTACGISSGEVVSKHHEDAYYYTQMICSGYNTQGSCTVWVPITNHVDEKWIFTLENDEGKRGDVSVPKSDYDKVPLGTTYTKPE